MYFSCIMGLLREHVLDLGSTEPVYLANNFFSGSKEHVLPKSVWCKSCASLFLDKISYDSIEKSGEIVRLAVNNNYAPEFRF